MLALAASTTTDAGQKKALVQKYLNEGLLKRRLVPRVGGGVGRRLGGSAD
ncbi:hypothetical protein SRABI83_02400 [Arthrobacter sp. Bi83]|nr:hypothetical protein SRABI83_02400 [Arthrobacter sp. Bi83]